MRAAKRRKAARDAEQIVAIARSNPSSRRLRKHAFRAACSASSMRRASAAVDLAGQAQLQPAHVAMRRETVFDLASLTKVIFTTTAILRHVEQGRIALDQPLGELIPDLRQYDLKAPKRSADGAPVSCAPDIPAGGRAALHLWPGSADLARVRAATGLAAGPAGLFRHQFHPARHCSRARHRPAAEASSRPMRASPSRPIRPLARRRNSAGGASACCAARCTTRTPSRSAAHPAMRDCSARSMPCSTSPRPAERHGAPSRDHRSAAHAAIGPARSRLGDEIRRLVRRRSCSDDTIGHTGFTGTGLWIDFARGIAWSLLTNRVHPTRHFEFRNRRAAAGGRRTHQSLARWRAPLAPACAAAATRHGADANRSSRKSRNTRTFGSRCRPSR